MEIISEYIFLEKKWSDSRKSNSAIGLTVFQEFHLVLVFAEFFSRPGRDVTRNTVFLSLFGSSSLPPTRARSRVLGKFVSTAITESIAPVSKFLTHFAFPQLSNCSILFLFSDFMRSRHLDATNWAKFATMFGVGATPNRRFHNFPKSMLRTTEIVANGGAEVIHTHLINAIQMSLTHYMSFPSQICREFHDLSVGFVFQGDKWRYCHATRNINRTVYRMDIG